MNSNREEAQYQDIRLAGLYDILNQWDVDNEHYMQLAGQDPLRILDAGCGTGMVAVKMAALGHDVVAVDPAAAMLTIARNRPGGNKVEWHESTLQSFRDAKRFDLIFMSGHAFQCFITDQEIAAAFHSAARLLAPTGRFSFESRNPLVRAYENWTREQTTTQAQTPDGRKFTMYHQLVNEKDGVILFKSVFDIEGEAELVVTDSQLRFASLERIMKLAANAGLSLVSAYGDWDNSKLTESSREMILSFSHNANLV